MPEGDISGLILNAGLTQSPIQSKNGVSTAPNDVIKQIGQVNAGGSSYDAGK
jgi:hypothetical protein